MTNELGLASNADEYALAFAEARRSIDAQAHELETVRARMGTLFSVAAVVAALPADAILERSSEVGAVGAAGLVITGAALAVLGLCVVLAWWPAKTTLKLDGGVLVGSYIEADPPAHLAEIHRELALHQSKHVRSNRSAIEWRMRAFAIASIAFLIEILGLGVTMVDLI